MGAAKGKNMTEKTEKWLERLLPVLPVVILYIVCAGRGGFYYSSNDDSLLTDILSGSYSGEPDAHDIYHIYPLAAVFALLYKLLPGIPWYGGALILAQFVCLYLVTNRCGELAASWKGKLAASALALAVSGAMLFSELRLIQYTMTSAIMAATAIFLLVTEKEKRPVAVVLLYLCSCLLRSQMGLLLLPFLLTACFYRWLCSDCKRKAFLYYLSVVGVLLGILAVCFLTHRIADGGEDWKAFEKFNQARTDIYDFGSIPSYDVNEAFYESLSVEKIEQQLLEKWSFPLSDKWDAGTLGEVSQYQKELGAYQYSYRYFLKSLLTVLQYYTFGIRSSYGGVLYLMAVFFVLLCVAYRRGRILLLSSAVFGAAHVVCWGYLVWRNRMPERVTNGLYLAEAALLIGVCVHLLRQSRAEGRGTDRMRSLLQLGICVILLLLTVGLLAFKASDVAKELEQTEQEALKNREVLAYCKERGDRLYLLDTMSFAAAKEKITWDERADNATICGAWIANSPVYVQKLQKFIAAESLQQGLSSGRVSFIAAEDRDMLWLDDYLASLEENCRLIQTDKIVTQTGNDYLVYDIVTE